MTPALFTASWGSLHLAHAAGVLWAVPVRTSRSVPKFWPEAEAFPYLEPLAPEYWVRAVWEADAEKGARCYRRGLHVAGLERVQAELDAITERYERPLALACFEQDRRECHRGPDGFAGWYERKTGMAVPELSLLQGLGGGVALVFERARLESSQNRKEARSAQSLPAGETPCKSPGIAHNREKPDNHPPGPGGSYVFYFRYPTH